MTQPSTSGLLLGEFRGGAGEAACFSIFRLIASASHMR
jgi:hypothetical protein